MGAYLSEPIIQKESSDESNELLLCGASSMQGWRISQEDAHNCILNFDEEASLFAVYDGHGGKEVAIYTAQHLPEIIKKTEAYAAGDIKKALKDAFLEFDASLTKPEVIQKLKEIADVKSPKNCDTEDDVMNLREEAQMPLEEVMAKYQNPKLEQLRSLKNPVSPFLRAKRSKEEACASSSSDCTSRTSLEEKYANGEDVEDKKETEETSEAQAVEEEQSEVVVNGNGIEETTLKAEEECTQETLVSSSEESEKEARRREKGKMPMKRSPEKPKEPKEDNINHEELFQKFLTSSDATEDSSDSDDANFIGNSTDGVGASEDDDEEEEVDEEDDEDDEDDDNEDVEEEEDDEEDEFTMQMTDELKRALLEERPPDDQLLGDGNGDEYGSRFLINVLKGKRPGSDSGCTAIVALVHNDKLYVANAGDSRCIASKAGKAVDLSFDHKPEDEKEQARIVRAGGKVTMDGRVNGGLNLSRALGDHVYKKVSTLTAEEQMISPVPDIEVLDLTPDIEFIVLACDGIWNSMSSQEVVEFVRPRLIENPEKLSKICEELFDHCLAPSTMGDGTGCDNMTAVIVRFQRAPLEPLAIGKRSSTEEAEGESAAKRSKTDLKEGPAVAAAAAAAAGDGEVSSSFTAEDSGFLDSTNP